MASKPKKRKKGKEDFPERYELKNLLDEERDERPLPEEQVKEKVTITNEKGETVKTSLKDLEEELKASDVGKRILSGGSLTVPVVDYIKDKYKLMSVETTERLERELKRKHQELISMGFSEDKIIHSLTGEKKPSKNQKESTVDPKDAAKYAFKEK